MQGRPNVTDEIGPNQAAPVAMLYLSDSYSENVFRTRLNVIGIQNPFIGKGGILGAIKDLAKMRSPRMLIVDISGVEDPIDRVHELAALCDPQVGVIVVGETNDVVLYRSLKNAGVAEYFFKPIVGDVVGYTCNALLNGSVEQTSPGIGIGKLVIMLGTRGGAGVTTIGTQMALYLANERKRRTVLVDLDLEAGDIALQLGVEPQRALGEVLAHPERIDDLFLERGVTHISDRLDLLASLEPLDGSTHIEEDAVLSLLTNLLRTYRYVFVDLPAYAAARLPRLMRQPSTCFLVSDCSLTAARDVARWRTAIGEDSVNRTTFHILNKKGADYALPLDEFLHAVGTAPDAVVSYKHEVGRASVLGATEVMKCRSFLQELRPALQTISGEGTSEARRGFFRGIFG